MRIKLRFVGIAIMLIGAVTYAVGVALTPSQAYFVYENDTRNPFKLQRLLWPQSSPELNPLTPIGFYIALLGAAIGILGIAYASLKSKSARARTT